MNLATVANDDMLWGIAESALQQMRARTLSVDLAAALKAYGSMGQDSAPAKPYEMDGETAIIDVSGPLMKGYSFWCYLFGGTSMESLQRAFAFAGSDPDVKDVKIVFDTPGGTVAGVDDTARAIRQLAAEKPVAAYISDCCCSCGYWLASQCGKITANSASAMIGNIGTLLVVDDLSAMFDKAGIARKVYKSSPLKGAGTPGTPITKAQDAEFQSIVDGCNDEFVAAVAAGRGVTLAKAQAWATAHVYLGKEALSAGLIDGIAGDAGKIITTEDGGGREDDTGDGDGDQDDLDAKRRNQMTIGPTGAPAEKSTGSVLHTEVSNPAASAAATKPGASSSTTTSAAGMPGTERSTMKEKLIKALTRLGLHRMAVVVVGADDDQESQAAAMASQINEEVQDRIDKDPLIMACNAAGIRSVADLGLMMDQAKIGNDAVDEARREAKQECIRDHGAEKGLIIGAQVNTADYRTVKMLRDSWRTEADAKHGFAANGEPPARATAPAKLHESVVAEGTAQTAKTAWEQLTPAQQKRSADMGFTASNREAYAREFLELKGVAA